MLLKNEYRIEGELTYITLKKRSGEVFETIIDTKNLPEVMNYDVSWHVQWDAYTKSYYCKATVFREIIDGKKKYTTLYLHSVIMKPPKGEVVDHKNHNTLDNTEENLEISSKRKNDINRRGANPDTYTGVRNVTYDKKNGKYIVQLQINRKNKVFGRFTNLDEATKIAEEMRKKYYTQIN